MFELGCGCGNSHGVWKSCLVGDSDAAEELEIEDMELQPLEVEEEFLFCLVLLSEATSCCLEDLLLLPLLLLLLLDCFKWLLLT